ncbi:MAG: tRNA uridine-5-carboxymethylaminomethyl(34) synthesis GTPase MnmE [Firmicutes bacterium]|nr:tRNA uridine-5-carboxymethylaminomethyl(34) synthesis GTPase MnmE [Bacillota bacterium]
MEDTICAISTSMGIGAISIVRVTGPNTIDIVESIFDHDLKNASSHTIHYGHIKYKEEKIDEVLVMLMRGPKTYTTEDTIEINCHGGVSTTKKIMEVLLANGCRLAEPGEFTKRAYLNGRINLLEAESVNDLIIAKTDAARTLAINNVDGKLTKQISNLREKIAKILANIEVNIDYPEYNDELEVTKDLMHSYLDEINKELIKLVNGSKNGRIIKNGVNVAIIGKPNVGKSSILNSLLDEEKAIVTNIPGTTRDIVEGSITLNGVAINFIDTAGIRKTEDIVEKIGVDKSKKTAENADIILFVLNNNESISEEEKVMLEKYNNDKLIVFVNKMDLESKLIIPENIKNIVYGNTIDINGLEKLKERITEKLNLSNIVNKDMSYLCNLREIDLVNKAYESLKNAQSNLDAGFSVDMIEIDLKSAWDYLGEIMGDSYEGELVDKIFSNFCLGK